MCCLTDNKGLFEGRPRDVVPWRSASSVDGPFVGPQQRRFRLGLARGAFWWREGRGQRAAGGMACEAVQRIISAPTEVKDSNTVLSLPGPSGITDNQDFTWLSLWSHHLKGHTVHLRFLYSGGHQICLISSELFPHCCATTGI